MLKRKKTTTHNLQKSKALSDRMPYLKALCRPRKTTRVDGLIKGDVKIDTVLGAWSDRKDRGQCTCRHHYDWRHCGGVNLIASDKITISATGKVTGNLHTKKLVVDENAVFFGQCFMGDDVPKPVSEAPLKAAEALR